MQTNNSSDNFFSLGIDTSAKEFLKVIAMWARIIAIIGFISAGLSVINALFGKSTPGGNIYTSGGGIVGALIIGGITVSLNIYLMRFALNTAASLTTMNQQQFNEGANNLRVYFKFLGILVIIVFSLLALALLFFLVGRGMGQ